MRLKHICKMVLWMGLACVLGTSPTYALDKDFGNWNDYTAHRYTQNGVQTCNMYTPPLKVDVDRPKAQFNVTNRPQKKHRIAIHMGIKIDTTLPATLKIGTTTYPLVSYEEYVFVDPQHQQAVIYKMKMGARFTVTATSVDGEKISDMYSLIGFTKALQSIDKFC